MLQIIVTLNSLVSFTNVKTQRAKVPLVITNQYIHTWNMTQSSLSLLSTKRSRYEINGWLKQHSRRKCVGIYICAVKNKVRAGVSGLDGVTLQ